MRIRTALLEVKSAAALTIGTIAKATKAQFGQYITDAYEVLIERIGCVRRLRCRGHVCVVVRSM